MMQNKADELLKSIGKLVKNVRSETMDQSELGKRVGVSRTTISSIERGIGVNSKSLFNVVSFLDLADLIQAAVNERAELIEANRSRKARNNREELSNDF
ncbi:helix-turn-helix domain-containing protein [Colwellia sp. E2M01]|uniref:helix-turn-helix domain-containing protein n=1 Tax=Colwellia sp. E2M01 TaxID=2841561 RepID=UPI001C09DCD6|nr:helix-turn-helix domain-containing protein [Colwellia sp. E2M01]MBU2869213.1 helix-turn-helix domain-containing protein [Colwellia sp. E2M01]